MNATRTAILPAMLGLACLAASLPAGAQPCSNPAIAPTTPTADFDLESDGTTRHRPTGLVWMRCALGQTWTGSTCTGAARPFTQWREALQVASDVNSGLDDADNDGAPGFAGETDWRLPSMRELASIQEACRINPALNIEAFPNALVSSAFWTSTTVDSNAVAAWGIGSGRGTASFLQKSDAIPRFARLVRGGDGLAGHVLLGRIFADGFEP
ncbi:MAG: DUF1566 domain-containing protein [Xanthomonadales bacterium]|nr:DUF1566 domain-containing protein [Xanthomonadales bacterium]